MTSPKLMSLQQQLRTFVKDGDTCMPPASPT